MRTCNLCNGILKNGRALFTAECSHSFHFQCTASYVKHGNQICPICQAKWNDIPFQDPTSDLSNKKARTDLKRKTRLPQFPAYTTSDRHRKSPLQAYEPGVFNDDDPLDSKPEMASNSTSNIGAVSSNSNTTSIDVKTYPEVSAVQSLTSQENFTILINLQANVTSSDQANDANDSQTSRAPIDLVTVLDVSGSMEGSKIKLLKKAMRFLIKNLGPSDRLSVISFSSTARRLFPLSRMTDSGKKHARKAVKSLLAGGTTNILEGLRKGAKVIEDRREKNPVCSIMLLSDGNDTSGGRTHVQKNLRMQIPVHTFGFGADHDSVLLYSISEVCRGTFSFIEAKGDIQDAFAQCIGGLLSVTVQNLQQVHVQAVHPDLRLRQIKAGSYSTLLVNDNRTGFIDVGDLYADEERDFLVLVNVPVVAGEDSSSETKLVNVWCAYKDPCSKENITTEAKEVKIQRPEIVEQECVVVSMEVNRQKNRLQAAEAMAESRAAADTGDLSRAQSILESCRRALSKSASSRAGDQLSVALDEELKDVRFRMANMKTYNSSGRAYCLAGLSACSKQRASARSGSFSAGRKVGLGSVYRTRAMDNMLKRSRLSR